MTFLRAALGGLLAGLFGTLAMDGVWFARYRLGGGDSRFLDWESAAGLSSWDDASAPARVGKLLYETLARRVLPASRARLTTNVMHWGYGLHWGVLFGVAIGSARHLRLWHGPLLGSLAWLTSYAVLPIAGVYKPIWQYDPKTLWDDLSAHLVYGVAAAATLWEASKACAC